MSWERAYVVMAAALGEPEDPGVKSDVLPKSGTRQQRAKAMAQVLAEVLLDIEKSRLQ
jgi:hypothetical protein